MSIAVLGLLAAAPARADTASMHATVAGTVATTDNVFASDVNRDGDIYTQLRPGVLFAYDAPRMIHELNLEMELLDYAFHNPTGPSLTYRAGYAAFFTPGPRTDVLVSTSGSTGYVNALTSRVSADQGGIAAVPAGAIAVDQADATENVGYQAGKHTRTAETIFARYLQSDDNAMMPTRVYSAEVGANLTVEHAWKHDSLGLVLGGSVLRLERVAPMAFAGTINGSILLQQANPRANVQWRHDVDRRWSTSLDVGALVLNEYGTDPYNPTTPRAPRTLYPTVGALVAYTEVWGRASVTARHAVAPNLLLAENTLDDSIVAQLALPLPWLGSDRLAQPRLVGLGTIGFDRTQLLSEMTAQPFGAFDVARLDVALAWTPRPGQTWGVRYEIIYQHGDSTAALLVPSFYRNTLMVTFALRYPERLRTRVPPTAQSVRADRRDLAPIGTEPVVIDPAEEAPDNTGP